MHFNHIAISQIKNLESAYIPLSPLMLLHGENGAGKSAILESLRLGATGRSSYGTKKNKIEPFVGKNASVELLSSGATTCTWRFSPKILREGDDHQGNMPITLDEFTKLTGDKKLALIGSSAEIDSLTAQIEQSQQQLKTAKASSEADAPVMPEPYSGPALADLEAEKAQLEKTLQEHDALVAYQSQQRKASDLPAQLETVEQCIAALRPQVDEKRAGVPKLVSYSVRNGKTHGQLLDSVNEVLTWYGSPVITIGVERDSLVAVEGLAELESELNQLQRQRDALVSSISQACPAPAVKLTKPLSDEEYETAVLRQSELSTLTAKAQAFNNWETQLSTHSVAVQQALKLTFDLEEQIERMRAQRANCISKLKGPLEEATNKKLARVGLDGIELVIECNARASSLTVQSTSGLHIDVMAKSVRLLHWLCLLSAMHELSDAKCPILVAECAEMNEETLRKAITAVGMPSKGNVVLEHWLDGNVSCPKYHVH